MTRDMTAKQFSEALSRHGMREAGFLGYVNINVPGHHIEVSKLNAGTRRRAQLAYLVGQRDRALTECSCGHIKADHCRTARVGERKQFTIVGCSKCECASV